MESLQDPSSIYNASLSCDQLFDKCLTQIVEPRTSKLIGESAFAISRLARDHQARFQAWSSYLGVFAEHDVCLDRRLSNSKDIRVMVMDLLRIIAVSLQNFLSIIRISEEGSNHIKNAAIDLGQTQESIEGAIDRLHRLGVTIRHSSTASLASRVKAFSAKRSDPSLEEISFLMVKFLYPTANSSLQRLLGRSILERYFNLKYREEHQRRLESRRSPVLDDMERDQSGVYNGGPITQDFAADGNGKINELADRMVDADAILSKAGTKPSTLQADDFQRNIKAENQRIALSATSRTSSVAMGEISYPKPPKPSGDGDCKWGICSWCSESIPFDKLRDTRWWRRHVNHDLRPYVCLFDTCSASLNAFDSFTPWLNHMEEHHSINWIKTINYKTIWRCDIEHQSPERFGDEALLEDHMRKHHIKLFTESQLLRIARRSSIRIPGSKDVCPLCGFDASEVPLLADQFNNLQSPRNKRRRKTRSAPRADLNAEVQTKRTKVHFQDQAETSIHGPSSSSESDLELTRGPGTDLFSPQIKARSQRKKLSRHIATHLTALSFMSLRLKAFQEQSEEGDQGPTTDEQEDTTEGGEPSGLDTELEALSLNSFGNDVLESGALIDVNRPSSCDDFEIALICALQIESNAVEVLFDGYEEEDYSYGKAPGDPNAYTTGRMAGHNVVLAFTSGMGKVNSANVAAGIRMSFPNIKLGIVVGICGGVPGGEDGENEVLLGDVIISTALKQYDFGRQYDNKTDTRDTLHDNLTRPNKEIRSFLSKYSGLRGRNTLREKTSSYLEDLCAKDAFETSSYPGAEKDILYRPDYRHKHHNPDACEKCANCQGPDDDVCDDALKSSCADLGCQDSMTISRARVEKAKGITVNELPLTDDELREARKPFIHFGTIGSGDQVMKSGLRRDAIAFREKVIAFEMEGAEVWDSFPTVVIKGVCDYADSHKNKMWQKYAAATAAACSKAFLEEWRKAN